MYNIFIESKLPNPLDEEETNKLFDLIKKGDLNARNKIVIHNIRLVLSRIINRFAIFNIDKEDLVSIGNIGLIKAVDTFDNTKKVKFNTYATTCIDNEIIMYLRKEKNKNLISSIDDEYCKDKKIKIKDTLEDNIDIEKDYLDKEIYAFINEFIEKLSPRDKEIIIKRFGFYGNKTHTQRELAEEFNITKAYVSLIIINNLNKIKKSLLYKGFIEQNNTKIKTRHK